MLYKIGAKPGFLEPERATPGDNAAQLACTKWSYAEDQRYFQRHHLPAFFRTSSHAGGQILARQLSHRSPRRFQARFSLVFYANASATVEEMYNYVPVVEIFTTKQRTDQGCFMQLWKDKIELIWPLKCMKIEKGPPVEGAALCKSGDFLTRC